MAGTWNNQNKILPGAYINFLTNAPLTITPGDRGVVLLLQELSAGTAGEIYTITAKENDYPEGVTTTDTFLAGEALKGAKTVKVYNLGKDHESGAVTAALEAVRTEDFNVLVYPYDGEGYEAAKAAIAAWVKAMIDDEGKGMQAVLANYKADSQYIISVSQGVKLADGKVLTPAQTSVWAAGITAGAKVSESNTGRNYTGAIDVVPRMTKTEMEAAVTSGKFILKVDTAQNVTVVYDINSLTTLTEAAGKPFTKNRVIRILNGINNDITEIFEANYVGKMNNTEDGRSALRANLIDYFKTLQGMSAIKNFVPEDVKIAEGKDSDAVVIDCHIQPVDSIEKMYITVSLS
ncbi:hypothetical protein acsn021_01580 [Anaerocolumna cellulosilytica]|uniref:Uncharacterized protein n=1 Tax=Anaerocolumna cellulosilytica TaxID=433286 RepID=A0A6S6QU20_9FIRM|nr:phage tail sheath subtilisin-like domain-containing protein [Anaerocolumna cellulosilytica]MBB5197938.1 hypothetical protein [Anaerocolumna cellulosilytica]BCJ92589.1 hypothetical protein acsn021_01580 [Anaerocolumna cellulosilytica]